MQHTLTKSSLPIREVGSSQPVQPAITAPKLKRAKRRRTLRRTDEEREALRAFKRDFRLADFLRYQPTLDLMGLSEDEEEEDDTFHFEDIFINSRQYR